MDEKRWWIYWIAVSTLMRLSARVQWHCPTPNFCLARQTRIRNNAPHLMLSYYDRRYSSRVVVIWQDFPFPEDKRNTIACHSNLGIKILPNGVLMVRKTKVSFRLEKQHPCPIFFYLFINGEWRFLSSTSGSQVRTKEIHLKTLRPVYNCWGFQRLVLFAFQNRTSWKY